MSAPNEPDFGGRIGRTYHGLDAVVARRCPPASVGPNVVMIVLDDTGFAHFGCYGSELETPNIDRLAANGLRYTNFHTTALCSPTRAALLTGRNQHAVGMRGVSNWNTGFPHMRGGISPRAATVAEVLRDQGYATFAAGQVAPGADGGVLGRRPVHQLAAAEGLRPLLRLPPGRDRPVPPRAHQRQPPHRPARPARRTATTCRRTSSTRRPAGSATCSRSGPTGRSSSTSRSARRTRRTRRRSSTACGSAAGSTTAGTWCASAGSRGSSSSASCPPGTTLAPPNPGVPAWDDLSENQQRVRGAAAGGVRGVPRPHRRPDRPARRASSSAGGQLDNTLLMVLSDNGASREGGPFGVMDELRFFNAAWEDIDEIVADRLDDIGGPHTHSQLPVGLGPGRQHAVPVVQAEHLRGRRPRPARRALAERHRRPRRDPPPVPPRRRHRADDPRRHRRAGARRTTTALPQMPVHGTSIAADVRRPGGAGAALDAVLRADGPPRPLGRRLEDHDLPRARAAVRRRRVGAVPPRRGLLGVPRPRRTSSRSKLRELIDAWWVEAGRHGVLPLDDRTIELFGGAPRPGTVHARQDYVYYPPIAHIPADAAPPLGGRSWTITAEVEVADGGRRRRALRPGRPQRRPLVLRQGRRRCTSTTTRSARTTASRAPVALAPGRHELAARFDRDRVPAGRSRSASRRRRRSPPIEIPKIVRMLGSTGLDIGRDAPVTGRRRLRRRRSRSPARSTGSPSASGAGPTSADVAATARAELAKE